MAFLWPVLPAASRGARSLSGAPRLCLPSRRRLLLVICARQSTDEIINFALLSVPRGRSTFSGLLVRALRSAMASSSNSSHALPKGCVANDDAKSSGMSIITRSGLAGRDPLFGPMRDSVLRQDFSRLHHLISTQHKSCGYLPPWREEPSPQCGVRTTIVQARLNLTKGFSVGNGGGNMKRCPHNKFLKELLDSVGNRSWIMIVDDDARLLSPHHVSNVMREASRSPKNTVLLQPSRVGNNESIHEYRHLDGKTIWPMHGWPDRSTAYLRVDMTNLVFHQSMAKHIVLSNQCGADKLIFRMLLRAGGKPRELNANITGVGIWGNFRGQSRGGSILGRMWRNIGSHPPKIGTEFFHVGLARLLAANVTDIPRDRMNALRLKALRSDNFIRAGSRYFQPSEVEVLRPPAGGCTSHSKTCAGPDRCV